MGDDERTELDRRRSEVERHLSDHARVMRHFGRDDTASLCERAARTIGDLRWAMLESISNCESCIDGKIQILQHYGRGDGGTDAYGTDEYRDCPSCTPLMEALAGPK